MKSGKIIVGLIIALGVIAFLSVIIVKEVVKVKSDLIKFLYSDSNDKTELNNSINKIKQFIDKNKDSLGRSLSLRVYRLMRDVIMGVENAISIKVHRTPQTIRAYCELFIYIFPFYYAPTLIYNLGNVTSGFEIGSTFGGSEVFDTTSLVYGLNIIISFIWLQGKYPQTQSDY